MVRTNIGLDDDPIQQGLKVKILGSGTNAVLPERGSPGYLLEFGKTRILADSGAGTLYRLALSGRSVFDLHAVCYSHLHPDHVSDILPLLHALKRDPSRPAGTARLELVGPASVIAYYERLVAEWGPSISNEEGLLQVEPRIVSDSMVELGPLRIRTLPVEHTKQSVAYGFEYQGRSVVYSGDTELCPGILDLAKGADLVILDCAFPHARKRRGHASPAEALALVEQADPKKVVLTHIHPGWSAAEWREIRQLTESPRFLIAEDFLEITLPGTGGFRTRRILPRSVIG